MELVYEAIRTNFIEMPDNFGGFMGWSINNDMASATTAEKKSRMPGSYAMYMTPCAIYNQCSGIIPNVDVGSEMTEITVKNESEQQGINNETFQSSGGESDKVKNNIWISANDFSSKVSAPVNNSVKVTITNGAGIDLSCENPINTKDTPNGVLTVAITEKGSGFDIECSYT
jgi:hypothetical protein